ncbi:MAG: toprim domain-containing protein [Proteobacteria bacterium]|nr:toprim domain-containing protein [Pseudomonadota bacterium]
MRELMLQYGFDVHPIPDGEIHRFKGPGDKRPNCWYAYHGDHGAFGSWRTDLKVLWREWGGLSPDESRKLYRKIKAARRRHACETKARHERVAKEASKLWNSATPCIGHTYLSRKSVLSHGLKVYGVHLIVPMYFDGKLWSLQKIATDGTKRFLPGGKVSGCYYPMGSPRERLWLAEGYATAATLHELTGDAVACCFDAVNLVKVATTLYRQLPGIRVTVGADNDKTGLENATRAAAIVGGKYVYPEFEDGDSGTDWNDFASVYGRSFARKVICGC